MNFLIPQIYDPNIGSIYSKAATTRNDLAGTALLLICLKWNSFFLAGRDLLDTPGLMRRNYCAKWVEFQYNLAPSAIPMVAQLANSVHSNNGKWLEQAHIHSSH